MNYKKSVLPNGLRILTVPVKDSPTVMVLVAVETGANYEEKKENGLSHFLEHMCFKGTTNRPGASVISRELDGLGAENNAFTGNEMTGYYAKAAKKHFSKIFDIVSDLYLNPTLPVDDLEKERGVILEEISMYEDLPQRKVWDVLSKLMYGDTPAGRTILGPRENIKGFRREDFVRYRDRHYVAGKTIVVVAGDVSEKAVLTEVKKRFGILKRKKKISKLPVKEAQTAPALAVHNKKTDQTHMVVSFRAPGAKSSDSQALKLLAEVLGQGMSSRLFVKLRDEMGACYYVRASLNQYTDHGDFSISTGVNVSRTKEVVEAILGECRKLTEVLVPEDELAKAKEHLIGHLYMGLETTDAMAEFYVDQEVAVGKIKKPAEIERSVRKISANDIKRIAKKIFRDENLNLAVVGDINDEKSLRSALSLK